MTSPWTDGELVTAAIMYARITALLQNLPAGYLNDVGANDTGTVLLAGTGSLYRPANTYAQVTFTTQRRVLIEVAATYLTASSTAGRYTVRAGYNSGTTPSTPIVLNPNLSSTTAATNTTQSIVSSGTVVLPAGIYQVYPIVSRVAGGNGNDSINGACYVRATDLGPA